MYVFISDNSPSRHIHIALFYTHLAKSINKKSALERKFETQNYLEEIGIPYIEHLPTIEEEEETKIRTGDQIAKRILILTYLSYIGEVEEDKPSVVTFLKNEGLWDAASPGEKGLFLQSEDFEEQIKINLSWKSECILIMLWAIKKIEIIELPTEHVEVPDIIEYLPDFMANTSEFVNNAQTRTKSEFLDQSDLIYRLHWATRNNESATKDKLNSSVVMERHYAINWMTNYENLEWDEITTDT